MGEMSVPLAFLCVVTLFREFARALPLGEFTPVSDVYRNSPYTCTNCTGLALVLLPNNSENGITLHLYGHVASMKVESAHYDIMGEAPEIQLTVKHFHANSSIYSSTMDVDQQNIENNRPEVDSPLAYVGFMGRETTLASTSAIKPNFLFKVNNCSHVTVTVGGKPQTVIVFKQRFAYGGMYGRFYSSGDVTLWPDDLLLFPYLEKDVQTVTAQVSVTPVTPLITGNPLQILGTNRLYQVVDGVTVSRIEGMPVLQFYLLKSNGDRIAHYFVDQSVNGDFSPFTLVPIANQTTYVQFVLEGDELYGNGSAMLRISRPSGPTNSTSVSWNGILKSCMGICVFMKDTTIAPWAFSLAEDGLVSINSSQYHEFTSRCLVPTRTAPHKLFQTMNCSMNTMKSWTMTFSHEGSSVDAEVKRNALFYVSNASTPFLNATGAYYFDLNYGDVIMPQFNDTRGCNLRFTLEESGKAVGLGVQTPDGVRFLRSGQSVRFTYYASKGSTRAAFWNAFSSSPIRVKVELIRITVAALDTPIIVTDETFFVSEVSVRMIITPHDSNPVVATRLRTIFPVDTIPTAIPYSTGPISVPANYGYYLFGYSNNWGLSYVSMEGFPNMILKAYNITLVQSNCSCTTDWLCGRNDSCLVYPRRRREVIKFGVPVTATVDRTEEFSQVEYILTPPSNGLFQLTLTTSSFIAPALLISESSYYGLINGSHTTYASPFMWNQRGHTGSVIQPGINQTILMCGSFNMSMTIQVYPLATGTITFQFSTFQSTTPLLSAIPGPNSYFINTPESPMTSFYYCPLIPEFISELVPNWYIQVSSDSDLFESQLAYSTCSEFKNDFIAGHQYTDSVRQTCSMYKMTSWFMASEWHLKDYYIQYESLAFLYTEFGSFSISSEVIQSPTTTNQFSVSLTLVTANEFRSNKIRIYEIVGNYSDSAVSAKFGTIFYEGPFKDTLTATVKRDSSTVQKFMYSVCLFVDNWPDVDLCNITNPMNRIYYLNSDVQTYFPTPPPYSIPLPSDSGSSSHWYYYGGGGGGAVGIASLAFRISRCYARTRKRDERTPLVQSTRAGQTQIN